MKRLIELLMKKMKDRLNMILYTERKFENLYSYKHRDSKIKKALLYFPDSSYMHLGDQLFFEPLAKNLKKIGIEVKVYPTRGMAGYFKALGYNLADENWQKEEYDLIVSRPSFFPELKEKSNVFFYDYITSGLKNKICSDILEKVFKAAGLELDSEVDKTPTMWNGGELFEDEWENSISSSNKYILFNNYLDSGKAFNFRDRNLLFEDKIMELKEMGYKIIQLGTVKERELDEREYPYVDIDLRGKTSVEGLFRLCSLENVHGNLGFDGFLMHLCFLNGKRNYIVMRNKVTKRRGEQTKMFLNPPFETIDEKIEYLENVKIEKEYREEKIIINGRFITQSITGVQRFAWEILKELDNIIEKDRAIIITPADVEIDMDKMKQLKNIRWISKGRLKGHLWEQLEFPFLAKKEKGIPLNLCNSASLLNPGILVIHDIQTKVFPQFFSKSFSSWYNFLNFFNLKRAKKIFTVSEFSKSEIMKYYGTPEEKISVIHNGWQHMERVAMDESILDHLKIRGEKYILGVSSLNPNKNFKYIIELAKIQQDFKFVIVGKRDNKVFAEEKLESADNIIWTGYLSDSELKALYSHAEVFLFPSIYEGFGIPPLEALACGCKNILISETSSLPEIYGDSANYINPYEKINTIKCKKKDMDIKEVLEKYSWKESTERLLSAI